MVAGLAIAKAISAEQDPFSIVGEVMRDYDPATEDYCKNDGRRVKAEASRNSPCVCPLKNWIRWQ
jgi:hypothetical protein